MAAPPPTRRLAEPPKAFRPPAAAAGPPRPAAVPPDLEAYAESGDVVSWFPGADPAEQPQAAVVTAQGCDSKVAVNVFHPALGYTVPQDGAYHMDSPKARIDNGAGGWRHRPITVAVRRMLLQLGALAWNRDCSALVEVTPPADQNAGQPPEAKPKPPAPTAPAA